MQLDHLSGGGALRQPATVGRDHIALSAAMPAQHAVSKSVQAHVFLHTPRQNHFIRSLQHLHLLSLLLLLLRQRLFTPQVYN